MEKEVELVYEFGTNGMEFHYIARIDESVVEDYLLDNGGKRLRDEMGKLRGESFNIPLSKADVATVLDVLNSFDIEESLYSYVAEDEDFLSEYFEDEAHDVWKDKYGS